jgi:HEPN domain-containing protein
MNRKRLPPDDPREWLNRAHSNLARARIFGAGMSREDACFDAQQAAEKAIKAVFVLGGTKFPFIHDLEELLQRLAKTGIKVPKYLWDADELSRFAVMTRYPGVADPVTEREYRRAVRLAEAVVRWAERQILRRPKKQRG